MSEIKVPMADDIPAQHQDSMPADEHKMTPAPDYEPKHPGSGKLEGKVALVTGGDSGIGRAVSVLFAREGAKVAIAYLEETRDAEKTAELIEKEGGEALLLPGDLGNKAHATSVVEDTVARFGQLNIVVNNAAQQWMETDLRDISEEHLRRTFDSNVMAYFFVTQAALDHLSEGDAIVNTASVNAFKGNNFLVDYSSTRGAITAFSRSMAQQLAEKKIRVNCVAPGPIWTPFIPGTLPADKVEGFGGQVPMNRPGQPWEVATSYLFLASSDGNYFTGQTLHPNGGMIVGS
jgi:NAD(P)-dependent dehydrogenase (short-subunit alcohol dehydrogenase family)